FLTDRNSEGREPYWDDLYPHEILHGAPYDGILVSRAIVGDHLHKGKYSESQSMRFRRDGARKFLRLNGVATDGFMVMGDCGAFSYARMSEPPYTVDDMIDFYAYGRFTHGCSLDHVILEFDETAKQFGGGSEDAHRRYQ